MLQGRLLLLHVLPEDQTRFLHLIGQLTAGERVQAWNLGMRGRSSSFRAAVVAQPVRHAQSSEVVDIRWQIRDVSGQVAQEQALQASKAALAETNATLEQRVAERTADLRASEERLRFITENLDDVFWLATPDEQTILYISPSYERLFGRSCESLYAAPLSFSYFAAIHPDDRERVQQQTAGPPDQENTFMFRLVRSNGTECWVWAHGKPIFDEAGTVVYRVGIIKDINVHKEYEAQIEALAYTDPLTGLANRRWLFESGALAFEVAQVQETELALLYLDLNQFKAINDRWGHQTGDQLLQTAAARLQLCVRPTDIVARLGGDEFAVLLVATDREQAMLIAQRIVAELTQPFMLCGRSIDIGCSIGIATLQSKPQSFSHLVTLADEAMYRAKTTSYSIYISDA